MNIGEIVLGALSSEQSCEDGESGPGENPLWLLEREYPDFANIVRGKRVLDFGCGFGHQAAAIAERYGATVTGLDNLGEPLEAMWKRYPKVRFLKKYPEGEKFDVVISQNAMEHFPEPYTALFQMKHLIAPGGLLLITFAPPWYAPYGSHMRYFCRVPWLQLWFSEETIMAVRARYRSDGAKRFAECTEGLNQMSLRKFEGLIRDASFRVERLNYRGIKGQRWLTVIPILRELFTAQVTTILSDDFTRPSASVLRSGL